MSPSTGYFLHERLIEPYLYVSDTEEVVVDLEPTRAKRSNVKGVFRECSGELALLLLLRDLLDTKQINEISSLMSTTFWVI